MCVCFYVCVHVCVLIDLCILLEGKGNRGKGVGEVLGKIISRLAVSSRASGASWTDFSAAFFAFWFAPAAEETSACWQLGFYLVVGKHGSLECLLDFLLARRFCVRRRSLGLTETSRMIGIILLPCVLRGICRACLRAETLSLLTVYYTGMILLYEYRSWVGGGNFADLRSGKTATATWHTSSLHQVLFGNHRQMSGLSSAAWPTF